MKLVFKESPLFTRLLADYLTDDAYRRLQEALMIGQCHAVYGWIPQTALAARRQQ
jgi:hypothetical protein